MKKTTRRLLSVATAAVLTLTLFCTISDDNGNPVDPGSSSGEGDAIVDEPTTVVDSSGNVRVLVPTIFVENTYAGIDDTVRVDLTLRADVAPNSSPLKDKRIDISSARPMDYVSKSFVRTDDKGQAYFLFAGAEKGTVEITLTYSASGATVVKQGVTIVVTDNLPRKMTLSASPAVLAADGSSKSVITVQVKNGDNNPFVGDIIRFSSTLGLITKYDTTDADGKATALLMSEKRNDTAIVTAAFGSQSETIRVLFSGVTITATATPETIKPDPTKDSAAIRVVLRDAANNPIVGETVIFRKKQASTTLIKDTVKTDGRGEANCVVKSSSTVDREWITVRAAGAEDSVLVTYSLQNIEITQNGSAANAVIDISQPTVEFNVRYTQGTGALITSPDAKIKVTVTMGTLTEPDTIFAKVFESEGTGRWTFTVNSPKTTGLAIVHVKGEYGGITASNTMRVNFVTGAVSRIELVSTPAVIGINNGRAKLTATAYDADSNRVANKIISFNIIKGTGGGGEYLDPPTATTVFDGTASTYLMAGTIPSSFKGVWIVASDYTNPEYEYDGVRSDTVQLTIAGPPKYISVRKNDSPRRGPGNATVTLGLSAVVSDINNNPVPDGTEVTFSALTVAYVYYKRVPKLRTDEETGETVCVNDAVPVEVESEYFGKNTRPFTPFPYFDDVNHNGFPDRTAEKCGVDALTGTPIIIQVIENVSDADLWNHPYTIDSNNKLIVSGGGIPAYDIDINHNGVADPNNAVIITRTVLTKNSIADNELIYPMPVRKPVEGPVYDEDTRVRIWAECQGLVTSSYEEFILPAP